MRALLGFLSLTTTTQLCLLVNQLVLLPLQLRVWGGSGTSEWLVVAATAGITGVSDLGLRNAGHADLLASVRTDAPDALRRFRAVWALTRALLLAVPLVLALGWLCFGADGHRHLRIWASILTISFALDMLLIVRGIWLDTLGEFSRVELVFLAMVTSRIALSATALAVFRASPLVLSCVIFATGAMAVALQALVLRRPAALAITAGGFAGIRRETFATIPSVIAEPATNWARISLPVIVLAAIAGPTFVTSYVALRSVFGLGRQVSNQLARFASVRYVQLVGTDPLAAEAIAIRSVLLSTLLGVAITSLVIVDRGRLLHLWLRSGEAGAETAIGLCFAVAAIAYGYQVIAGVLTRSGAFVAVARRQYAFLVMGGIAAVLATVSRSTPAYLALSALGEATVAVLFFFALGRRIAGACCRAACSGLALVILLWATTIVGPARIFDRASVPAMLLSFAATAATVAGAAACCLAVAFRHHAVTSRGRHFGGLPRRQPGPTYPLQRRAGDT